MHSSSNRRNPVNSTNGNRFNENEKNQKLTGEMLMQMEIVLYIQKEKRVKSFRCLCESVTICRFEQCNIYNNEFPVHSAHEFTFNFLQST